MKRRLVFGAAVSALVFGAAQDAGAQGGGSGLPWANTGLGDRQVWLQNRQLLEGRGIRTGNFELHPGVGADFGFDSNTFYTSSTLSNNIRPALRLRVTPTFYVSTLGAQRAANSDSPTTALPTLNFRGGVGLVYNEWIGVQSGISLGALRNLGAQGTLRFDFFPGRTWQFGVGADFVRLIQPGGQDGYIGSPGTARGLNRNTLLGNVEIAYAPGRGVFELRFGYNIQATLFDEIPGNNSLTHTGFARMRWRFLPKTALVWEGFISRVGYLNDPETYSGGLFSATPMTTRFGLAGLLTNRVSLTVLAGYAATFYELGDNADTPIGQAEIQWIIDARSQLRGGFVRDVQQSYFGNYFIRNRGYASYMQSFGGRFVLNVDAGVGLYQYGYLTHRRGDPRAGVAYASPDIGGDFDPTTKRFNATRIDGTVFGEYRMNEIFGVNATIRAETLISGFRTPPSGTQPIDWTRVEAMVGVRANW